jgi:orotate phosphoribosyltransferase
VNNQEIYEKLQASDAIRSGHFQLTSGRHSDTYIQCARVLEHPTLTLDLAREMVARLPEGLNPDVVAAPAVGGIIIGFAVALALDVPFLFSERQNGVMVFRRAFEVSRGARVLVVEDVVTTGGSVNEVVQLVEAADAEVVGVTALINRGGPKAFSRPFYPLLSLEVASWDFADCHLCADGVELYSPGSRRLK